MIYLLFFVKSFLLGVGLAADAFTVSLANGLSEPNMCRRRMAKMAGVYAFFQFAMPLIGWALVHTIVELFRSFTVYIPWMALILLLLIGGKMVYEGIWGEDTEEEDEVAEKHISKGSIIIQGIATSIDALSVGFAISDYGILGATVASLIIGAITFIICLIGIVLGRKIGTKISKGAVIIGGLILIGIGIEIFVKGVLL